MLFAHVVPRKDLTHEHIPPESPKDLQRLGYQEVTLKCDGEGFFLGMYSRTAEAIIGGFEGVRRAATMLRVVAHRTRDVEGLSGARGVLWSWKPEA